MNCFNTAITSAMKNASLAYKANYKEIHTNGQYVFDCQGYSSFNIESDNTDKLESLLVTGIEIHEHYKCFDDRYTNNHWFVCVTFKTSKSDVKVTMFFDDMDYAASIKSNCDTFQSNVNFIEAFKLIFS